MHDEKSLIERAQRNDQEAIVLIYETYFDRIYRYIFLRIGNQAESEDMTQQVFMNALQSISSFRWRGAPFSAWLFRIARNQVIDHQRKFSRIQTTPLDLPIGKEDIDPAEVVDQELTIQRVREAMKSLTQLQQEVLSLRFAGEMSTRETARIMGKREGAVKALQHSALAALRRILVEEQEHDHES